MGSYSRPYRRWRVLRRSADYPRDYFDTQRYEWLEEEQYEPEDDGKGFALIFLIVVLMVLFLFAGPLGQGDPPPAPPTPQVGEYAYTSTYDVPLRYGPGLQYREKAMLAQGLRVRVLEEFRADAQGQAWTKVRAGTVEGWVNQADIQ